MKLDRNFVFIHIPKAGGTSVTEMLFELMKPHYPREKLFDYPLFSEIEAPSDPSLFISHLGYSFFRGAGGYGMTVMREPRERILSLFSYWKNPGDRRPPGDPLPEGMTLEEFLSSDRQDIWTNVRNAQTWQIAFGLDARTRERLGGILGYELLDIALSNVRTLDVVGVIEEPDNFTQQLLNLFPDQAEPELIRANQSVERLVAEEISDEARAMIDERIELDMRLYHYVRDLAAQRASVIRGLKSNTSGGESDASVSYLRAVEDDNTLDLDRRLLGLENRMDAADIFVARFDGMLQGLVEEWKKGRKRFRGPF